MWRHDRTMVETWKEMMEHLEECIEMMGQFWKTEWTACGGTRWVDRKNPLATWSCLVYGSYRLQNIRMTKENLEWQVLTPPHTTWAFQYPKTRGFSPDSRYETTRTEPPGRGRLQLQIVPRGAPATGMPAQTLATICQGDFLAVKGMQNRGLEKGLGSWKATPRTLW